MCKEIIFLSNDYYKMLKASGISFDYLTESKIREHLSAHDCNQISSFTQSVQGEGKLLDWYKLANKVSDGSETISRNYNSLPTEMFINQLKIDAYCPNKDSIILWELEQDTSNSNCMFKCNLKKILKAMTRVMSFEEVVSTPQFELLILRA